MRIVTRGAIEVLQELPVELTCPRCSSVLSVEEPDLQPGHYTSSVDSYGDTQSTGVYVNCPVCREAGLTQTQVRFQAASSDLIRRVHYNRIRRAEKL